MEELKQKIFDELREKNLKSGQIWKFQDYNPNFIQEKINPVEEEEFFITMSKLCDEEYFVEKKFGGIHGYCLTEKGEKEIYGRVEI